MQARFGLTAALSVLLLALFAGSCGTGNVGVDAPNLTNQQSERAVGVVKGGFEVVRHNQQGNADADLNPTLALEMRAQGNETALVISVNDSSFTTAVTLDINYDETRYHPVRAEFTELLGSSNQVLTAAFLDSAQGVAGLGAAAIGEYRPGSLSGELATVWFAPGPDRMVSAAGDAHENPQGVADILENVSMSNLTVDTATPDTVVITWTSAWMLGNGDGNKEVNAADLVPIAAVFRETTGANFAAVRGDYDRNTEANAADLTRIAQYFRRFTDAYRVEASDNTGAGTVLVATLDGFDDQQSAVGPPSQAGGLTTVFPFWTVTIAAGEPFTYAQLQALDVNSDGFVRISITPLGPPSGANGVTSDVEVTVGSPVPPTNQMVLNAFSIAVNDGAGTEIAVLDSDNSTLAVEANSSIGFTLNSVAGTYNGVAFDGRPAQDPEEPGELTQAHYDLAFEAARDLMITNLSTGGDAAARRSSEWVTFATGSSPYTGVLPTPGTVFPDWDPESVLPGSPEGGMSCSLPTSDLGGYPSNAELNVQVIGAPIVRSFQFDVELDPAQPSSPNYNVDNGGLGGQFELVLNRRNVLTASGVDWGTGGVPADFDTVALELRRIGSSGTVTGAPVSFTRTTNPDVGSMLPGQFNITSFSTGEGGEIIYGFQAVVNMSSISQGANYALRLRANGRFSTLNVPDILLTTAPPPPPQPMVTIPTELVSSNDTIQLYYQDPAIRRSGSMRVQQTPPPERAFYFEPVDQAAFDDLLRINGDEFIPNVDNVSTPAIPYPLVVVKNNTQGAVSGPDDPDREQGVIVIERGANRIVLDVASLTVGGGGPGDPAAEYNFIVYGQDGVELGGGSFSYSPFIGFPVQPSGLQWGVNAANRETFTLNEFNTTRFNPALNGGIRVLNADNVGTSTPPVIFFKFVGGSPFDPSQDEDVIFGTQNPPGITNPYVFIEDPLDPKPMSMSIAVRVAGMAPDGAYIMIHTVTENDFARTFPGWPGILDTGIAYDMYIIDPSTNLAREKLASMKFPDQMLVTGTNPWSP